ncbi:MAG: DNA cytosine methyltransferase [Clostridiales bacterium]|nr:DNA cytosine methyltransferase [Clostridiales bacterium]
MNAVSLFTSGGIGDLAFRNNNIRILLSNELLSDRHALFEYNFSNTFCITGDIWELCDEIIKKTKELLDGKKLDIIYATPPCQGMSKNGQGKLLNSIRAGKKPKLDLRNRLIIPTMKIINELKPEIVVFENVPEMQNTVIQDENGELINIIEYIQNKLPGTYIGKPEVVEFANYGVPQCRQRLITIFTSNSQLSEYFLSEKTFMPPRTHSKSPHNVTMNSWITVRDVIMHLPSLDAATKDTAISDIPFHRVPLLDEKKYFWVSSTPQEKGAFDNQCDVCGFNGNPTHSSKKDTNGINRTDHNNTLHCVKCGSILPRPWVCDEGSYRLMKGYTSAYRRMKWDEPATALTRNLSYACSDNKLHPEQNRVLSLYESFLLHTISDYVYHWERKDRKKVSDKTVREVIGESIPPRGLNVILNHLLNIYYGKIMGSKDMQLQIFI